MSAISGLVSLDDRPIRMAWLDAMNAAAASGGPDGSGHWLHTNKQVGLAHRRLIEVPEDTVDHQPCTQSHVTIAADLRVDNRDELRRELRNTFVVTNRAEVVPDARYVLDAYLTWGACGFAKVVGDFAVVLWDERTHSLYAVRDCFGIRPLYYAVHNGILRLASTIAQLRSDPALPDDLDDLAIEDYILKGCYSGYSTTIFQSIRQIPPAHYLCLGPDRRITLHRYWTQPAVDLLRYRNPDDYERHFEDVFRQAVDARLRSVGSVGLMLSGGLDSGAIAGVAAPLLKQSGRGSDQLVGYSFVYDTLSQLDERQYIEPLVQQTGIRSVYIYPENEAPFTRYWPCDDPGGSSAYFPAWENIHAHMNQNTCRVLLTGYGGETLLLSQSHAHFIDWFRSANWWRLARECAYHTQRHGRLPSWPLRELIRRGVPMPLVHLRNLLKGMREKNTPFWMSQSARRFRERTTRWRSDVLPRRFDTLAKQIAYERLVAPQSAYVLWAELAQSGHRVGVTYRHPFMDRRLHQVVYALPLDVFFDHGYDRAILRRVLKPFVPDVVRLRVQQTRFDDWFDDRGTFRAIVKTVHNNMPILRKNASVQAPFDLNGLSQLVDASGANDHPGMFIRTCMFFDWLGHANLALGIDHER